MSVHDIRIKRVVIVDDSRTTQAILESVLRSCNGFEVVGVASDALSATKMIDALRPDMVTIDLCMPYIDGATLLESLAGLPAICKIVVSDHAANNMAIVARLRSAGAAACIAKREMLSDPAAFLRKLRSVAAGFQAPLALRSPPREAATPGETRAYAQPSPVGFPIPADERERLDYIRRKQLANATPERQFDLLTGYLAQLTSFPVCLMTFIDKDTQWLKSAHGFARSSMPRYEAFCNHTIAQNGAFVVRNAANDPAFASHPLVIGDPHIRTYVGHPIITENGIHVGALCLIDPQVRVISDALLVNLKSMAEIAAEIINRRPLLAA